MTELSRRRLVVILGGGALATGAAAQALVKAFAGGGPESPTRGRGAWTTFGSVAVLGATRRPLPTGSVAHQHSGDPGFVPLAQRTWSDVVRVEVEVHNGLDRSVPMSPGQFRLRVGRDGPTVTPYETGRAPGQVASGATTATWISYLAPPDAEDLSVEFTEADASKVRTFNIAATGSGFGQHGHQNKPGRSS